MRNIAVVAERPSAQPSLTSHERKQFRAGLESLREYRRLNRANRVLPSEQRIDEDEVA